MPGELRADAKCPVCGKDLACLIDETNNMRVRRQFWHPENSKESDTCIRVYTDFHKAHIDRTMLEVPFHDEIAN